MTGPHAPLRKWDAEKLWAAAMAEKARRAAEMPDEAAAIRQLTQAVQRLKELGWKDPCYAPKDGSPLEMIEPGSSGIHRGFYDGEWPSGRWYIADGDLWPSRPVLARAAQ